MRGDGPESACCTHSLPSHSQVRSAGPLSRHRTGRCVAECDRMPSRDQNAAPDRNRPPASSSRRSIPMCRRAAGLRCVRQKGPFDCACHRRPLRGERVGRDRCPGPASSCRRPIPRYHRTARRRANRRRTVRRVGACCRRPSRGRYAVSGRCPVSESRAPWASDGSCGMKRAPSLC